MERMKRKMIIVIDANKDLNDMICQLLSLMGYEVTSALSGEEGIDKARAAKNWIKKYVHPSDVSGFIGHINKSFIDEEAFDSEFRIIKDDGNTKWIYARTVPIKDEDENIVEWIGLANDITLRKEYENNLIKNERNAQELVANLRKADEEKNEYISMIFHELRNPLAAITTGISVMELVTTGSEEDIKTRQVIKRQTSQLTRLVNDLLEVTRIQTNKIKLIKENIELNIIAKEIIEEYKAQFYKKEVSLEVEYYSDSIYINADSMRIKQIIGNILGNALKFTGKGGNVKVTVSKSEDTNDAIIKISDTGVGMEPELIENLFDTFVQADNSPDRSEGGLGLGLAIVKEITKLHGGTIEAKSEGLGKGSQFIVRLPMESVS